MRKPVIAIDFDGPGGNTMAIMAACKRAASSEGWSRAEIDAFIGEALSSDRRHVLDVVFEFFDVQQQQVVCLPVSRDEV